MEHKHILRGSLITTKENVEYLCAASVDVKGRHFVYLVSNDERRTVCFAEQLTDGGNLRIVTSKREKEYLLKCFGRSVAEEFPVPRSEVGGER